MILPRAEHISSNFPDRLMRNGTKTIVAQASTKLDNDIESKRLTNLSFVSHHAVISVDNEAIN